MDGLLKAAPRNKIKEIICEFLVIIHEFHGFPLLC